MKMFYTLKTSPCSSAVVVAVNNLSLDIPEGKIVALIGPNGAGKTTAFNCITGVYEPTNGLVEFMGKPIVRNHPQGKMKKNYKGQNADMYLGKVVANTPDKITQQGIARTFQNIRLWKSMTVFENVLIAKHMHAKQNVFSATFRGNAKEEKRMREETMELLCEQGLDKYKDEIATSLPYGLQRRLEIARALASRPELLLLDRAGSRHEPAGNAGACPVYPRDTRKAPPDGVPDRTSHGACYADIRLYLCYRLRL